MNEHPRGQGGSAFLSGVRVLDVTGALAGPYCTTILSDLGAEVIKVEPVRGDGLRRRLLGDDKVALPFDLIHRDKGSVAIDLKATKGKEIFRRLAAVSDVVVENFRAGAMDDLGLGYDDLKQDCPDLVYCSISGFGQTGPMRESKGVDLISQAYGGLMSVTGTDDGKIAKAGYPVSDLGSGMWGAVGVLAALLRARAGGGGSHIDVALSDTIASWGLWEIADYVATNEIPGPLGTAHRLTAPYEAFQCGDGRTIAIGVVDSLWPRLCEVLDVDLAGDPRFTTEWERYRNRGVLAKILTEEFSREGRDAWIARLREVGVACGPVNTIDEVVVDEQFEARGLFVRDREVFGQDIMVNTPIVADGAPRARGRSPKVGESTRALLSEIGYEVADIDSFAANGIVAATPAVASGDVE